MNTRFVKIFTSSAVYDQHDEGIDPQNGVRSKDRVRDQAEVFTRPREVNAMLDLIKPGPIEVTMSHLEPSCGDGAFLIEIIRRKLDWIDGHDDKDPDRVAAAAVVALSTTCGVDISVRNVMDAQARILEAVASYLPEGPWRDLGEAVVSSNIVVGDFLKCCGTDVTKEKVKGGFPRFVPDPGARFSEIIRFVRVGISRSKDMILSTGTINGKEEILGAFSTPEDLTEQILNLAECDESEMLGQPDKVEKVGRVGTVSDAALDRLWCAIMGHDGGKARVLSTANL